ANAAIASMLRHHKQVTGIGVVLGDLGDGRTLCGIDIDMGNGGTLPDGHQTIIARKASYAERSPGGGIHLLGYGTAFDCLNKGGGFERYCKGRYFTFTGDKLDETPPAL